MTPAAGVIGRAEFVRQMQHIAEQGWTVVSTSAVLDWLLDSAELPDRAVVIHFDNGWLDTYTVALPVLRELGFTATCYPITDGIEAASAGKPQAVRTLTEGVVSRPFMTWDQVQGLLHAGWEIGNHTAGHSKMADTYDKLGDAAVISEIQNAANLFQKRLGFSPIHFAYPSGSRNVHTDEILAPSFRSLRLWHDDFPIVWTLTDLQTSRLGIECQNIDARIPFDDYKRIFSEAMSD
jgi:peptidoglycan/xylan/chitin deacetylase (PgdA/CDA1 family)